MLNNITLMIEVVECEVNLTNQANSCISIVNDDQKCFDFNERNRWFYSRRKSTNWKCYLHNWKEFQCIHLLITQSIKIIERLSVEKCSIMNWIHINIILPF